MLDLTEWRFEGPVVGMGIFRGVTARAAKFRHVFQGRGNMCRNADDFRKWVLQVRGPRADDALYGVMHPRAGQSVQARAQTHTRLTQPVPIVGGRL